MADREKEINSVKALLRAVLQSNKGGVSRHRLLGEYRGITGDLLPYRELGFENVEDFMRAIPDCVTFGHNKDGEPVYLPVADAKSAHIQRMVSAQKGKKARRGKHLQGNSRRPGKSQSAVYKKLARSPRARFSSSWQRNSPSSYGSTSRQQHGQGKPTQGRSSYSHGSGTPGRYSSLEVTINTDRAGQDSIQNIKFGPKYNVPPRFQKMLEGDRQVKGTSQGGRPPEYKPPPPKKDHTSVDYKSALEKYMAKGGITGEYETEPGISGTFVSSIRIRGHIYGSLGYSSSKKQAEQMAAKNACEDLNIPTDNIGAKGKKSNKSKAPAYNLMNELEKDFHVEEKHHWDIGEVKRRVKEILSKRPNGLFSSRLPVEYEEKHRETLPPNIMDLLQQWTDIVHVASGAGEGMKILTPVKTTESTPVSPKLQSTKPEKKEVQPEKTVHAPEETAVSAHNGQESKDELCANKFDPEILELPENDDWDVNVTAVKSASQIVLRLIGPGYSEALEELEDEMFEFYNSTEAEYVFPQEGGVYAVPYPGEEEGELPSWLRVRTISGINDKAEMECYNLDYGDTDMVDTANFCVLLDSFKRVAYQALQCTLTGLQQYEGDNLVLEKMCSMVLGKTCVAAVDERVDEIGITLWDTSTDDDINLNQVVSQAALTENLTPKLPKMGGTIDGFISYVTGHGTVFFQVDGPGIVRLEKLVKEITEYYSQSASAVHFVSNPTEGKLCAAKDSEYGEWYRAKIKTLLPQRKTEVYFVDYGNTDIVLVSSLREFAGFSKDLESLPFQAVQCNLHELPPEGAIWTETAIDYMDEMVADKTMTLEVIQEADEDNMAVVELYYMEQVGEGTIKEVSIKERLLERMDLFQLDEEPEGDFPDVTEPETVQAVDPQDTDQPTAGVENTEAASTDLPPSRSEQPADVHSVVPTAPGSPDPVVAESRDSIAPEGQERPVPEPQESLPCQISLVHGSGEPVEAEGKAPVPVHSVEDLHVPVECQDVTSDNETADMRTADSSHISDTSGDTSLSYESALGVEDALSLQQTLAQLPEDTEVLDIVQISTEPEDIPDEEEEENHEEKEENYDALPMPSQVDISLGQGHERDCVFVHVIWVFDPNNFRVTPYESFDDLQNMMADMKSYYDKNTSQKKPDPVAQGKLYACLQPDGNWYRVTVTPLQAKDLVNVNLVDFGQFNVARTDSLRPLPAQFRHLPFQSVTASLSEVRPYQSSQWSQEAITRFVDLAIDQDLAAFLRGHGERGELEVVLVDTSNDEEDIILHDILIKEQLASPAS